MIIVFVRVDVRSKCLKMSKVSAKITEHGCFSERGKHGSAKTLMGCRDENLEKKGPISERI